ncbi:MAG: 1-acyl-sn-glycerol-3-phosphate acyltransferase [Bacteroidales bacterium]|nr:1-acyl-sn-glycerol-3-phosphate acyltransferase [Bacteroidales bacterium]
MKPDTHSPAQTEESVLPPVVIDENYIDLTKIMAAKGINMPRWAIRLLNRLLHVQEINKALYLYRDKEGADFAQAVLDYLQIKVELVHGERLPRDGKPIIVANHPLGGPDGLALIAAVGSLRNDIRFPVNDFLMYLPHLRPIFVAVDKVHGNRHTAAGLNEAFAAENALLYFPAGICSRRIKGRITDLEWKPTVVKKAIQHQRDLVPVRIEAQNRRRFYTLANLRKRLGIKFNFEMALLPSEMMAQRGKTFRMVVGEPISWQRLDDGQPAAQWAATLHDHIYSIE